MYNRKQLFIGVENESVFFWGARQTGKSTLLKILYPNALIFDLLLSRVYNDLAKAPDSLRETVLANLNKTPVIIDEVQRLPNLLNEVQWLIVNHNVRFILSGSSPRKIIRSGANLLFIRKYTHIVATPIKNIQFVIGTQPQNWKWILFLETTKLQ